MQSTTIGIVAGALITVFATTASAQTVRACVSSPNGRVRLTSGGCRPNERLIEWNVQGPRGPEGPQGPMGPQGPAGPKGAQGLRGADGPQGLAGAQGLRGADGPQGPAGAQGAQGLRGADGAQGLAGAQGLRGADGPQGLAGAQGAQGLTGDAGARGLQGTEGARGLQGDAGPQGAQGPQGPQGAEGRPAEQSGALLVIDATGQDVGYVTDVYNGYVVRKAGDDMVWFVAPSDGLPRVPTIFFHSQPNCGGERYVQTMGGQGLANFARVHGGAVFYTRTKDPYGSLAVPVQSYELVDATEDATLPGRCAAYAGTHSLGVVTTAFDPPLATLVPPFRIK
jgi:collagen triple helix repeat protein